eukprot:scaffold43792_cov17-Tisochrysis_lutea.AAC.1
MLGNQPGEAVASRRGHSERMLDLVMQFTASRNKNKKNINVGKAGDLTGGLDDYIYDDAGDADD